MTWAATQMGCKMRVPSVFITLISSFIKMLMNIVFIYHLVTCAASFPGDKCAISLTMGADRELCLLHTEHREEEFLVPFNCHMQVEQQQTFFLVDSSVG